MTRVELNITKCDPGWVLLSVIKTELGEGYKGSEWDVAEYNIIGWEYTSSVGSIDGVDYVYERQVSTEVAPLTIEGTPYIGDIMAIMSPSGTVSLPHDRCFSSKDDAIDHLVKCAVDREKLRLEKEET